MTELVRLTDITKVYQGGVTGALNGVSLAVEEGEFTAVMGPSGSGNPRFSTWSPASTGRRPAA
jgi:putative ABC transport system ATP-binding protein